MNKYLFIYAFLVFFLSAQNTAYAFLDRFVEEVNIEVESLNRFFPESDEKNEKNEITVTEAVLDVNMDINPERDISWELDFGFKNVFISDNSSSIDLPSLLVGRSMRIAAQLPAPLVDNDQYRVGISVIPSYYTDSWKDSFNDFEYGAFRWLSEYWIEYEGDDQFTWKVGVLVRPDYDLKLLPVVGMNYRFNDNWSFRLTSDDIGLLYQLNDKVQLFTEHRYVLDEYEISTGGRTGRVLRHKQNTTGVGVRYDFNEQSFAKFSVGGAYNRSFKFVDGEDEGKAVLEDSIYTTFELIWNF